MLKARFILTVFFVNLYARTSGAENLDTIDFKTLVGHGAVVDFPSQTHIIVSHSSFQRQAKEIGDELWSVGESITKRSEVQEVKAEEEKFSLFLEHALLCSRVNAKKDSMTSREYLGAREAMNE